jgi:hypothetical protein
VGFNININRQFLLYLNTRLYVRIVIRIFKSRTSIAYLFHNLKQTLLQTEHVEEVTNLQAISPAVIIQHFLKF